MEEGRVQAERDGLLTPIMDQLAELQHQLAGLARMPADGVHQPSPEEIIKGAEVSDLQESALTGKGNKDQYKFCRVILALVDAAASCWTEDGTLDQNQSDKARGLITALRDVTKNRIKLLIRLADRSDAGWQLVQHYEADRIASDTDDERRIRSAEKMASTAGWAAASQQHEVDNQPSATLGISRLVIATLPSGSCLSMTMLEQDFGGRMSFLSPTNYRIRCDVIPRVCV